MQIPEEYTHARCEHDEDGIPRFQMRRNAAGKLWRKRISEEARKQMRVALFMDQLNAALLDAHKAVGEEGITFIHHGDETEPDALRRHWARINETFGTEVTRVQQPATKLHAAIKALLNV